MKSQEHQKAFNLFFQTDFTQKQIADMLNIDRKTLFTWAKEGNWKRAKHTVRHAPTLLAEQYYDQLAAINEAIATREERPYPTKEEAAIIKTLTATIKQIGKRQTLSEVMEVFIDFELEVQRTDKDFAQKMIFYMDKYIHTLASYDNELYKKKYLWERRNDQEYIDYLKEQEELTRPASSAGASAKERPGEKGGENGEKNNAQNTSNSRHCEERSNPFPGGNGAKMGSSPQRPDQLQAATVASNQNSDNTKESSHLSIVDRFKIPIKETKNTPLIITNCTGEYSICIRNLEGRMALNMTSNKPEERIDVRRLPSAKYTVTILDADGNYYRHEVMIRN